MTAGTRELSASSEVQSITLEPGAQGAKPDVSAEAADARATVFCITPSAASDALETFWKKTDLVMSLAAVKMPMERRGSMTAAAVPVKLGLRRKAPMVTVGR